MESRTIVRRTAAALSVAAVAACSDSAPTGTPSEPSLRSAVAQDRIEAIFQRTSPEVMALPGTVFSDNDERVGKVVIGVENMNAAGAVRAAMARLGVAERDYAVELTQPIHNMATLRDRFRPTKAGLQVHFTQYVCSIGANVDHDGGRSFIINSHCTATQGGTEGTVYYQPTSSVDPTVIATEVDDPVYFKGGVCPRGKKCRYSDAARALYSSGVASSRGHVALTSAPNNLSLVVTDTAYITGQDNSTTNFAIGTVVNKVGRTTGWTRGQVTRTCVNTSVSGSQVMQLCQTFVSDPNGAQVVGGGDSGSGVWTGSTSGATLVGLLWGGSSDNKTFIFSPLASVQKELGAVTATK